MVRDPGPKPDYTIRAARPADAMELARLRYRFRTEVHSPREAEDAFLERCRRWMAGRLTEESNWRCWVAEAGGGLVGTLWMQKIEKLPNPADEEEHHAYISSVYVLPEHRDGGVGGALLDRCLETCDRSGVDVIFLWSTPKSRRLYRRKGFAPREDLLDRRGGDR